MNYYLPIIIVVLSNTFYHVCAKSLPEGINTFAALSVTYIVGAVLSLVLFFVTNKGAGLFNEYRQLNWSSIILGAAIIGLEAGFIMMYKAGWSVSTGQLVASVLLAIVLLAVGAVFYKEPITFKKTVGIAVCIAGLYLIGK